MNKKPIRLTEQDLHFLVENAVQAYLTENGMDEDLMGGLKAFGGRLRNKATNQGQYQKNDSQTASQPQGNFFNKMGQKINNFGNSVSNARKTFQMGSANGDAQKAITNATNALKSLLDADKRMKQAGGAGLMGNAQSAVQNAYQALIYNKNNAGNIRNQFQGSTDAAAQGGKFAGWK